MKSTYIRSHQLWFLGGCIGRLVSLIVPLVRHNPTRGPGFDSCLGGGKEREDSKPRIGRTAKRCHANAGLHLSRDRRDRWLGSLRRMLRAPRVRAWLSEWVMSTSRTPSSRGIPIQFNASHRVSLLISAERHFNTIMHVFPSLDPSPRPNNSPTFRFVLTNFASIISVIINYTFFPSNIYWNLFTSKHAFY